MQCVIVQLTSVRGPPPRQGYLHMQHRAYIQGPYAGTRYDKLDCPGSTAIPGVQCSHTLMQ